jgi:hypothetical protein
MELRAGQAKEAAEFLYSNGYTCRIPQMNNLDGAGGKALYPVEAMFPPGPPATKDAFIRAIDQKRYTDKTNTTTIDFFLNPYCRTSW